MKKILIVLVLLFAVVMLTGSTVRDRPAYQWQLHDSSGSGTLGTDYAIVDSSIKRLPGGLYAGILNTSANSLTYKFIKYASVNHEIPVEIIEAACPAGSTATFDFIGMIPKYRIYAKNTTPGSVATYDVASMGKEY